MHLPCRLSSKGLNTQRGVLVISVGAIKRILERKRHSKFTKLVFFFHDNAPSHRAVSSQKMLAYLSFHYVNDPAYYPDLAPSVHQVIPEL
jgi:hypothetical protein